MASKINKNKVIATAQKYVQKGQYDRAIREYEKIVAEDPRDVRIWLKIGDLHAKKNAQQEAVDTYLKVAEFYSEQGFYLKAVAVHKQILKLNPHLVEVNLKLAELYKQLGLLNDAMQQYELVSNHFSQQGRTKDALAAVRQIVDLDPENVASRIKLAELYSKEQMRDEAIEEFSKAADFLRAAHRIDDFIKVGERLVYHQPDNVSLTKELASLYLRRKDPRRALQKLQLAFKADPRDEDTLGMLAQAFEDLGQVAKTISVLRELARIHGENDQQAQRIETYRRILALAPDDEEALKALSQSQAAAPQAAQPKFAEAPGFDQGYAEPAPMAAEEFDGFGDDGMAPYDGGFEAEAHEEFGPVDDFRPTDQGDFESPEFAPQPARPAAARPADHADDVARVVTEAEVYIKYGLHDKAIDHLRQVFHRDPNCVEVRLKLRDLHLQLGHFDEASRELYALARGMCDTDRRGAAAYLNEALELDSENEAARRLLEDLESQPAGEAQAPREPSYRGYREDTFTDSAIDLDADDIVEEIPIDAADLGAVEITETGTGTGAAQLGSEVLTIDEPGGLGTDFEEQAVTSSAVIELHGETTNTLGEGTPSAEVIALPAAREQPPQAQGQEEDVAETVEDDLEEAEFFIQQNLFTEARNILDELSQRYPGNPLVAARQAELAELEGATTAVEEPVAEGASADLAAELAAELEGEEVEIPMAGGDYSVEDVFEEFKRGVDNQVSDEDSDTHYDLGIAYREMGLMDDAISEFQIAMRSRDKEVLCHMMIGLCHVEKNMISEAISQFKTGLYVEGITERETIALYFELGQAYEKLDDPREALYYYEKVGKKDLKFRDVSSRIERLRAVERGSNGTSGGGGSGSGGGEAAASAGHDQDSDVAAKMV